MMASLLIERVRGLGRTGFLTEWRLGPKDEGKRGRRDNVKRADGINGLEI